MFTPSPVKRNAPASPEPTPANAAAYTPDDLIPFSPPARQHEETRAESPSLSALPHDVEHLLEPCSELPSALSEATYEFKALSRAAVKAQFKLNKYTAKRAAIENSVTSMHAVHADALETLRREKIRSAAFDAAYPALLADRHRRLDAALARVKAVASPADYEKLAQMCESTRNAPKVKPVAPALLNQLSGTSRAEFIQHVTHENRRKSEKGHLKGGSGEKDAAPVADTIGSGAW